MRELSAGGGIEKKNPSRRAGQASVDRAIRALEAFTGHEAEYLEQFDIPDHGAGWLLGPVAEIHYVAKRDGETAEYVHRFKVKSRPLLVSSADGSQLYLLGGAFSVTDRGITDA